VPVLDWYSCCQAGDPSTPVPPGLIEAASDRSRFAGQGISLLPSPTGDLHAVSMRPARGLGQER
jgi:hypothetical protein